MEYITAGEAAKKWGVSPRAVNYLLTADRVPGAVKKEKFWLIPAGAERPADGRRHAQTASRLSLSDELAALIAATTISMPTDHPDRILDIVDDERVRLQYEAELAYLRGDFQQVMCCFSKTETGGAARLRACLVTMAATISIGDYSAYTEIDAYARGFLKDGGIASAVAELALAVTAVSCVAPGMAPERLKTGDFSVLPSSARPYAHYLRAMYFSCVGRPESMLAVAETALSFCASQEGILMHDIYLRLMCAVACRRMEREDEARQWLLTAMRIALPHGFITPFSEFVPALGGLMEQCLKQEFPDHCGAILEQWKRTWKNWITFHNRFTKDHITLILSLRQYHIAVLVARRVPYAKIAKQQNISVGRLKNIMLEIYETLFISGRDELSKYVL